MRSPNASFRYQQEVERHDRVIVGVNEYQIDEPPTDPDPGDGSPGRGAPSGPAGPRCAAPATPGRSERSLRALHDAAAGDENLMPYLLDAVRAYCTLGELTQALREVYGAYVETPVL